MRRRAVTIANMRQVLKRKGKFSSKNQCNTKCTDQYVPIQCEHSEFATETLQFKTVCAFSVLRRTTSEILTATWAEVVETLLP